MKRFVFCLAFLGLVSGQAAAVPGPIAAAPAATLLLPYFEADLDTYPNGITTLFSVNNAAAATHLAHVTMWSTWSVPVLDFDVYLTGYDVQTFNIAELLTTGNLPQTGFGTIPVTNKPGSPRGPYSFPKVNFPNCNPTSSPPNPPVYSIPAISASFRAHLRAWLTGKASPLTGTVVGRDYGDNIARGYVTVDDVNACSLLYPSSTGYFVSGGLGIAGNDNVLWGDYIYVDLANNSAQGETLVHIQADAAILNSPGEYTFYGRYVGGTAADNREPLPTSFATRYVIGSTFTGGTRLVVWRDSKYPCNNCISGPSFGSLAETQVAVFDETEQVHFDSYLQNPAYYFPDETQSFDVANNLPLFSNFGWIYLNLNHATPLDAGLGMGYVGVAQAWVETIMDSSGRFSVGYDAIQLDNANTVANPSGVVLGPP